MREKNTVKERERESEWVRSLAQPTSNNEQEKRNNQDKKQKKKNKNKLNTAKHTHTATQHMHSHFLNYFTQYLSVIFKGNTN